MGNTEISHKKLTVIPVSYECMYLQYLLSCTKTKFDIITISETRITRQVSLLNNLNLNNYSFEFTPTETSAGGTLLYIANHLSYKCRNDLNIYKKLTGIYFY